MQGLNRTPLPNVPILPANQYIQPGDVLLGYMLEVPSVQLHIQLLSLSPAHAYGEHSSARLYASMLAQRWFSFLRVTVQSSSLDRQGDGQTCDTIQSCVKQ